MATYRGMRVDLLLVTQLLEPPLCIKPSPLCRVVAVIASTLLTSAVRLAAEKGMEADATGLADTPPVLLRMATAAAAATLCVCVCTRVRVCVCGRAGEQHSSAFP